MLQTMSVVAKSASVGVGQVVLTLDDVQKALGKSNGFWGESVVADQSSL